MIDDWPTTSLKDLPVRTASAEEFAEVLRSSPGSGMYLKMPVGASGKSILKLHPIMQSLGEITSEEAIKSFLHAFCGYTSHEWSESHLYLLDLPCYIVAATGVIVLMTEEILEESIYPSTGQRTIERLVGGGLNRASMRGALASAFQMPTGTFAPLLSRWSNVYFHMVTECLVQDEAFARAGISNQISYLAPAKLNGSQATAVANARSYSSRIDTDIVRVPRLLFSSMLYEHAAMGTDFLNLVDGTRSRLSAAVPQEDDPPGRSVYVSRIGATARPMTNESQLIESLEELGFYILQGDKMSFDTQAQAFRNAEFIVGAHGAGLTNAGFARPGGTLLELRPFNRRDESPMWGDAYRKLSSIRGLSYCAHVSPNAPDHEEWQSDIPTIIKMIRSISSKL